jgi:hypothetical protein
MEIYLSVMVIFLCIAVIAFDEARRKAEERATRYKSRYLSVLRASHEYKIHIFTTADTLPTADGC